MTLAALPIDEVLPELVETLRQRGVVVLQAPPGAGKSTRVPPALLDSGLIPASQKILMLEPRRVAARAVAERIAQERGQRVGAEVGYAVRFERKSGPQTRLEILTEGLLLRRLQHDPLLEEVGCVILDEFHERSIHADLALAMLREVRQVREDLLLVVMSATLQMEPLQRYLDAPAVTSKGRTFPVTVTHESAGNGLNQKIFQVVERVMRQPEEQDLLLFLPGARQIHQALDTLAPLQNSSGIKLLPLYGALPLEAQIEAITSRPGERRVIAATNIAETSLTVEGVTTVVDAGLVKQLHFDPQSGLDRLDEVAIARDAAEQRAGRAGRVRPGQAIRLWSAHEHDLKRPHTPPEVARVDLLPALLEVIAWSGADPAEFDWFEPPSRAAIALGVQTLRQLGVLPEEGFALTEIGKKVIELPLHPRLARLLVEAQRRQIVEPVSWAAAMLSEGELFQAEGGSRGPAECDLWQRVQRARSGRDPARQRLSRVREQLLSIVRRSDWKQKEISEGSDQQRFARALLAAFPDRVCLRREGEGEPSRDYVMVGGVPLTLARESCVHDAKWLVATHIAGARRLRADATGVSERALIRIATEVSEAWLREDFPWRFTETLQVEYDPGIERVSARRVTRFDGLLLTQRLASVDEVEDGALIAAALARAVLRDLPGALDLDDEGRQLLDRLMLLRAHRPALQIPDLSAEALREPDEATLAMATQWCWGKRSVKELRRVGFKNLLMGALSYEVFRQLDEALPQRIEVPSGSKLRIDYQDPGSPTLAVRIQEVFGWFETPALLDGALPITLHLLAPNYRPAQVTQDLASFWKNTYPEVRKELRARYPKHAWPEDPMSAEAVRRGPSSRR